MGEKSIPESGRSNREGLVTLVLQRRRDRKDLLGGRPTVK